VEEGRMERGGKYEETKRRNVFEERVRRKQTTTI
jgi:hypothetical protein